MHVCSGINRLAQSAQFGQIRKIVGCVVVHGVGRYGSGKAVYPVRIGGIPGQVYGGFPPAIHGQAGHFIRDIVVKVSGIRLRYNGCRKALVCGGLPPGNFRLSG